MHVPPRVIGRDPSTLFEACFQNYVEDLRSTLREVDRSALAAIVAVLLQARQEQRTVFIIGNGGSAATASHMACDLGKGTVDRSNPDFKRFRALSLTDSAALMTALGNDLSFDEVFSEQLATLMSDGDVVIAISASGNSPNLIRAIEYAKAYGAVTIGLLGFGGGVLGEIVDHPLVVSSHNYGVSEDFHLIVQHVVTQYLRRALAGPARPLAFIDRDGIINQRLGPHEYVKHWEQFRFVDGAISMLRGLSDHGYRLVVVTNQQGVGKGVISEEALTGIHHKMTAALAREGIPLTRVLHCPHLEQDRCPCRKPRPGLIFRALNEMPFLVDVQRSIVVGDSASDAFAGHAAGIGTIVLVGNPEEGVPDGTTIVDAVSDVIDTLPRQRSTLAS
jgi:D-sedoheptulose 7-phosphate isomerase